jgi:hypothetical protein
MRTGGRRALRDEIQSTWVVYEPKGRPGPFSREGMALAETSAEPPQPGPASATGRHEVEPSPAQGPAPAADGGTTPGDAE